MKTIIRQANIKDAPIIAQVIGMGFGEDLLRQYCGTNGLAIMEALAKMEDSQYSYHHALIWQSFPSFAIKALAPN